MVDFNALAKCAQVVRVGGAEVKIRPPSLAFEREMGKVGAAEKSGEPHAALIAFRRLTATMMADMVITDKPVSIDDWERILKIPDDQQPDAKGMKELVDAVLKLCGLDLKAEADRTEDKVDEAASSVGKRSTRSP